jgi:hypothetical protein
VLCRSIQNPVWRESPAFTVLYPKTSARCRESDAHPGVNATTPVGAHSIPVETGEKSARGAEVGIHAISCMTRGGKRASILQPDERIFVVSSSIFEALDRSIWIYFV